MRLTWRLIYLYMAVLVCLSFCTLDWCINNLQKFQLRQSNNHRTSFAFMNRTFNTCQESIAYAVSTNRTNTDRNWATTFKFYMYELPPMYNEDLINCEYTQPFMCVDFENQGFGKSVLPDEGGISYRNSSQFSLAVIMHNKLKTNRLRTWNPDEADIFYIPAYFGLGQHCFENNDVRGKFEKLIEVLSEKSFIKQGRPHFSTLGLLYIWLPHDLYIEDAYNNITFLTMEAVHRPFDQHPLDEIIIPYPSYGHYLPSSQRAHVSKSMSQRSVFILLPIGNMWNMTSARGYLATQFSIFTELSYDTFMSENNSSNVDMVLYYTNECSGKSSRDTIPWMKNSVFCLQPSGDTDSRKSFYDSVISGCIPVIMPKTNNPYAFQKYINYEQFSIILPFSTLDLERQEIYDILSNIPESKLIGLQNNLHKISKWLQYSVPSGDIEEENDALQLIFTALSDRFDLPYDKTFKNEKLF